MAVLRKMTLNTINNKNKYNGVFMFVIYFLRQKKGHTSVHSFFKQFRKKQLLYKFIIQKNIISR